MKLHYGRFDLELTRRWAISSSLGPGGSGGTNIYKVVFVELSGEDGLVGIGEAAPSNRYKETVDTVQAFLAKVDASKLSFEDIPGSMAYLETLDPGEFTAKCAINIALMDGASRKAGKAIYDFLGLGFTEGKHVTSFSIGIDKPEVIREKVLESAHHPVLKLKVGGAADIENLKALRDAAPVKTVRVDANEAWADREEALRNIERLAADGHIEFIEQPMPANSKPEDLKWLKERSPLPLMADEAYRSAADISKVVDGYHMVNVKLVKQGGITAGKAALEAARRAGLKTMLGCMIESSVLISAAAQLAELTDFLDIDGNLLIKNNPYVGPSSVNGMVSFGSATEKTGLRVKRR